MDTNRTILLTGAAGFIGSYLLGYLNKNGFDNIIIVDDFSEEDKWFNFDSKKFIEKVEREELFDWLAKENPVIDFVFHLGARTDTTEFDYAVHERLNLAYSKKIWNYCTEKNTPLVYASSAATYGSGELGYKDSHDIVDKLQPLNPYGVSKNEFDKWMIRETQSLRQQEGIRGHPSWAGLKFFNAYGPNEYHKGRMASVIFHAYNQVRSTGKMKLFKSHKPEFKDGQQLRDFIYVEDIAKVCFWLMEKAIPGGTFVSGLYNLGTGKARAFEDLVNATFIAMGKRPEIEYIDIPEDIRSTYQYFTEADMRKLQAAGYPDDFYSLEEGVEEYVKNYLQKKEFY